MANSGVYRVAPATKNTVVIQFCLRGYPSLGLSKYYSYSCSLISIPEWSVDILSNIHTEQWTQIEHFTNAQV